MKEHTIAMVESLSPASAKRLLVIIAGMSLHEYPLRGDEFAHLLIDHQQEEEDQAP